MGESKKESFLSKINIFKKLKLSKNVNKNSEMPSSNFMFGTHLAEQ